MVIVLRASATGNWKGAATDSRKSDSRNEQTVGDWGPESVHACDC